jgi:hypothetical protein
LTLNAKPAPSTRARATQAISAGFCITRARLGEHRSSVVLVPSLYLLGALLLDGLSLAERDGTPGAVALLASGIVIKLAALVYAWVFVITAVAEERARLAERWARLRFVADAFKLEDEEDAGAAAAAAVAAAARSAAPSGRGAGTASSAAALPASLAASAAIIRDAATAPAAPPVAEGEAAQPFGPERAKERLLRAFARAVALYVAVVALSSLAGAFYAYTFAVRQQEARGARSKGGTLTPPSCHSRVCVRVLVCVCNPRCS